MIQRVEHFLSFTTVSGTFLHGSCASAICSLKKRPQSLVLMVRPNRKEETVSLPLPFFVEWASWSEKTSLERFAPSSCPALSLAARKAHHKLLTEETHVPRRGSQRRNYKTEFLIRSAYTGLDLVLNKYSSVTKNFMSSCLRGTVSHGWRYFRIYIGAAISCVSGWWPSISIPSTSPWSLPDCCLLGIELQ